MIGDQSDDFMDLVAPYDGTLATPQPNILTAARHAFSVRLTLFLPAASWRCSATATRNDPASVNILALRAGYMKNRADLSRSRQFEWCAHRTDVGGPLDQ